MYKLSPSKAHRFLNCTASLKHDVEFVETIYTIRGTLLHELGEKIIKSENVDEFLIENNISPYEQFLVMSYAKAVMNEYDEIDGISLDIEVKKPISIYGFEANSIIDALVVSKDTASIIDLKTGRYEIDPLNNEQLYFYAYGTIMDNPEIKKLRLSIFQNNKMKTAELEKEEILDYFKKKENVFLEIANDHLTYNPGEKTCKYCAIKDSCESRAKWLDVNNGFK